jgi:Tol biopolymer transport system component
VDLAGDVSYDGGELVFVDYDTGDLAVRNLRSGEIRRLTDKGGWEESGDYAMDPKLSPDGRSVAFTWAIQRGNTEFYELRIIGIDGTGTRTLYHDESLGWISPITWYPDGGHILAKASREGGPDQILQISVPDGKGQILISPAPAPVRHMSFSPDGRFLAYGRLVERQPRNRDLFVMTADGGREVPLVDHPAMDHLLGWSPDGRYVLFASDRQGTLGAWLLPVEGGEASGEPRLVRPDLWQMAPIGFAEDGSYFFNVSTTKRTVYFANLDPINGDLLSAPTPVGHPHLRSNAEVRPSWSPDGKFLAYSGNRGARGSGGPAVYVRSMETGETREIVPRGLMYIMPYFWSQDGNSILGVGRDLEERFGFHEMNVLTGETHSFPNFWGVRMAAAVGLTPDGESVVYKEWIDSGAGITVRGLEGDPGKILYRWTGEGYQPVSLSPGGEFLAFGEDGEDGGMLLSMPVSGGEPQVLVQFLPGEGGPDWIAWTPDGETIVYRSNRDIWRIPRVGGTPQVLDWPVDEDLVGAMRHIVFSPDGTRIAFDAESGEEELWVMENFLPGH